MRVTLSSINRQTQFVIRDRFNELTRLQMQMAHGQRLLRPSDGPTDTSNTLRLRTQFAQLEQQEANIWDGLGWMQLTDTTMTSMNSAIQRARELAIQADSDTLSLDQRRYIADELEQITRQIVGLMNTRFQGNYIFSGTFTDKPPVILVESDSNEALNRNNRMFTFDGSVNDPSAPPVMGVPGVPDQPNGGGWAPNPNTGQEQHGSFRSIPLINPNGFPNTAIFPGGGNLPVRNIIPGSVEVIINGQTMREGIDFRTDHINGTITPLPLRNENGLLMATNPLFNISVPDTDPLFDDRTHITINNQGDEVDAQGNAVTGGQTGLIPDLANSLFNQDFTHGATPGYPGGLVIRAASFEQSRDLHGDPINTDGRIYRQIEDGSSGRVPINISMHDFDVGNDVNIFTALIRLGEGVINGDSTEINNGMAWLDRSMHNILSSQSSSGSIINRMNITLERNELQQIEVNDQRSRLQEADYATTVTQFAIQQTVFNAALQSTARLMQLSLMDFIR